MKYIRTKDGMEWFDCIVKLKKASEVLEIIKEMFDFKFVDFPDANGNYYAVFTRPKNCHNPTIISRIKTQEEYDLVKEVLQK